jgi:trehalose/maltose transport system substrate-binding protein
LAAPRNGPLNSSGQKTNLVSRPSTLTGNTYERVTRAYSDAVHSVLTGQKDPARAAAELEKELNGITGFGTGPPKKGR